MLRYSAQISRSSFAVSVASAGRFFFKTITGDNVALEARACVDSNGVIMSGDGGRYIDNVARIDVN